MTRTNMTNCMTNWKMTGLALGLGIMAATTGCATTSATSAPLAAAQGAEDVSGACAGVPSKERELGLLAYREAIGGSAPMHDRVQIGKSMIVDKDVGVRIAVRAQPGLTAPWLARVASCHVALAVANQLETPDAKNDPLLVRGAQVSVEEAYTGFIVSIRGTDAGTVSELNSRTTAMLATPAGPMTAQAE
jgi:hypothetical protein